MNKHDIIIVAEKIDEDTVKYSNPYIKQDLIGCGIITPSLKSMNSLDIEPYEGKVVFYLNGKWYNTDLNRKKIVCISLFNEWYSNVIKELPLSDKKVIIIKKGFDE